MKKIKHIPAYNFKLEKDYSLKHTIILTRKTDGKKKIYKQGNRKWRILYFTQLRDNSDCCNSKSKEMPWDVQQDICHLVFNMKGESVMKREKMEYIEAKIDQLECFLDSNDNELRDMGFTREKLESQLDKYIIERDRK
ncbi:hypothetical protein LCGC14_1466090 [marine sediment metagenome]|uniref:Uncharacterized protein n=1 Tax=marine sediment metagenome TaxID=412755 RepID=A0A0F9JDR4_9ZZZZ